MIVSRFDKRHTYEIIGPAFDRNGVRRPGWVYARRTDIDGTVTDYHVRAFRGTTAEDQRTFEEMGG